MSDETVADERRIVGVEEGDYILCPVEIDQKTGEKKIVSYWLDKTARGDYMLKALFNTSACGLLVLSTEKYGITCFVKEEFDTSKVTHFQVAQVLDKCLIIKPLEGSVEWLLSCFKTPQEVSQLRQSQHYLTLVRDNPEDVIKSVGLKKLADWLGWERVVEINKMYLSNEETVTEFLDELATISDFTVAIDRMYVEAKEIKTQNPEAYNEWANIVKKLGEVKAELGKVSRLLKPSTSKNMSPGDGIVSIPVPAPAE